MYVSQNCDLLGEGIVLKGKDGELENVLAIFGVLSGECYPVGWVVDVLVVVWGDMVERVGCWL